MEPKPISSPINYPAYFLHNLALKHRHRRNVLVFSAYLSIKVYRVTQITTYSRVRNKRTPLNKHSPWNIWQKIINIAPWINVAPSYIFSRQFESFIHSQSKRKLKNVKKFFKKSKSINVAPFNKDVALGKNLKN